MATRPKAVIESHNGEELSPITIAKNVLTDDGQNLHDILSDRKEEGDMMTPTIENSSSMFKVGQGDDVDYSANVVNGAYESMVLKGKTIVNYIQESSSQDVVLPYEFTDGEYVTIKDTKESGALGVELKGNTLVNKMINARYRMYERLDIKPNSNNEFINTDNSGLGYNILPLQTSVFEPNKTYTFFLFLDEIGDGGLNRLHYFVGGERLLKIGLNKGVYTTSSSIDDNIYTHNIQIRSSFKAKLIIIEGNYINQDISHFEGMFSCKMPVIHTKNNLFNGNVEIGGYDINTGSEQPIIGIRCVDFIPISNTNNTMMEIINSPRTDDLWILQYNSSKNYLGKSTAFSIPRGVYKQKLNLDSNCAFIKFYEVGINRLDLGIEYIISDKSSILSLPEEVVLRSLPNGICDTLNLNTGEYIRRIGEIILSGSSSEQWNLSGLNSDGTKVGFFMLISNITPQPKASSLTVNNKLPLLSGGEWASKSHEGCFIGSDALAIVVDTSKLSTLDVVGINTYLQANPLTVQYELETPVITKINLPSTLKSWNTATHIYSEIPENSSYPILSHLNPTYPVILKPSTKYSIVVNSYSNDHTNSAINFNLGGAIASTIVGNRVITITTPTTLSNELVTMSGRGNKLNNVMVIEGDVVGDEPYFEGICDCKSPILTNLDANNEQSNTTTFNQKGGKTIVLRSLPNGVCDTLNVETGEYIQRIGEIAFDGSSDENWQMLTAANNWTNGMKNILTFICPKPSNCALTWGKEENEFAYLSNKFPSVQSVDKYVKEDREKLVFDQKDIKMATLKSKLNTQDLAGFKTWLQSNPVAVQYELAAPIVIKTVDLSGFPFSYENGHVILSSGSIEQSLTPTVEYSVVINRNGQIRSNQKMVERHQKQLDRLQAMILTNLINTQYEQTLTNLKYDLKNVREEVK